MQLEVPAFVVAQKLKDGFNSILVQLEDGVHVSGELFVFEFQFHIGAIRSDNSGLFKYSLFEFQFHIGAIRRNCYIELFYIGQMFQFHIGAIRRNKKYMIICFEKQFQFHIGAIRSFINFPSIAIM